MPIPSCSPGGKPATRALLAALEESAPAEEPTKVVFEWKSNQ